MFRGIGRLRAGGGGFNPLTLFAAGEQGIWYDPSDIFTLFQDSAGTTPVTASGQPVGKMLDKSGKGNHAIQATSANRPIYTVINGIAYLVCDGSLSGMASSATFDLTGTDKLTIWAGVRKLSDSAASCIIETSTDASSFNGSFYLFGPDAVAANYGFLTRGTVAYASDSVTTYTSPISNVLSVAYDNAGSGTGASAQVRPRINGVAVTNISGTTAGNYANQTLYLFRRNQALNPFNGNFYGCIIRGVASSAAQIAIGEQYLNRKMGGIY